MMFDGFIEVDLLKFNTKSSIFDTGIRSESGESRNKREFKVGKILVLKWF